MESKRDSRRSERITEPQRSDLRQCPGQGPLRERESATITGQAWGLSSPRAPTASINIHASESAAWLSIKLERASEQLSKPAVSERVSDSDSELE